MTNKKRSLKNGPNLDLYAEDVKKRYTTYGLGAREYSMNYYTFVKLVKQAGANLQVKKNVVVDLDILDAYIAENMEEGEWENDQEDT